MDEILIATPFEGSPNCWNTADWIVIISPCCSWVIMMLMMIIVCFLDYKEKREEDDKFIALTSLSDQNLENSEILPQDEEDDENN